MLGPTIARLPTKAGQISSCCCVQSLSISRQHGTDGDEIPLCSKDTAYIFTLAPCQFKVHEGQPARESDGTEMFWKQTIHFSTA